MKCISVSLELHLEKWKKERRQIMITKFVNNTGKVLVLLKYEFLRGTVLFYCVCFVVIANFCAKK